MLPIRKMTEKFSRDPKVSMFGVVQGGWAPGAWAWHPHTACSALKQVLGPSQHTMTGPPWCACPQIPADQDVAKRVFYLAEGRIRVDYHYADSRVTRSGRVFHKDGQSQIVQVGDGAGRW